MAKDRDLRYPSGEAFIAECDALLHEHPQFRARAASRPFPAPPVAPAAAVADARAQASRIVRSRAFVPAVATVVLLLVAALGWRLWQRTPPPALPPGNDTAVVPPVRPALPPEPPSDGGTGGFGAVDTATLLARAGAYLQQGLASGDGRHLAFPDGDNAIDLFREVLRRDPGNAVAARGLAEIAAFYEKGARSMLERGLDSTGADLVEKGLRAQPDNAGLRKLQADIAAHSGQGGS